jgi:hypothetical protein
MAMHLERIGGRFVAATVLLAVAGDTAFAQQHKTYRCNVADVVTLGDDGGLQPDSNPTNTMRLLYDGIIIDTLTGAVTHRNGSRTMWSVVQRGSRVNDYVLTKPTAPYGPSDRIMASAATDFIRIRAWGEQSLVRLLAFSLSTFASGPCEVVR